MSIQTVKLEILTSEFEEIASILEICGYKVMAQDWGCQDGDYVETFPEDRNEDFDPSEYSWQIW